MFHVKHIPIGEIGGENGRVGGAEIKARHAGFEPMSAHYDVIVVGGGHAG
jgi:hypothetical protein